MERYDLETSAYFKKVFDSLSDSIVIADQNFKIININDAAELLLNRSRRSVISKEYSKIFPDDILLNAQKAFNEERTISIDEIEFGNFMNEPSLLQVTATPFFSDKGNIEGTITQLRDIEGTKFLTGFNRQQLSNRNFENLILGLSHELKNPLSSIKGAAQLLGNELSKKEIDKCSTIIAKEADRLIDLLNRVKKVDELDEEINTSVDLHEILLDIIYLESKSLKNRIDFKTQFDVTIPPVSGNYNSLKQVFLNLISNAIQSIEDKGKIAFKTKWVNDYKIKSKYAILISVKDSGEGIPKNEIDKIFTPFFTTKSKGSGLGLFLSHQIIAKHGGAIFVESKLGRGSEFKVYLPAG